jgi:hypothetical protein
MFDRLREWSERYTPVFAGGPRPLVARFSLFAGVPTLSDNDGTSSNVAVEAVVRAPADGYTLLSVSITNAMNATLYDKLTFDSSTTSHLLRASCACLSSWRCIRPFRRRLSPSSSPTTATRLGLMPDIPTVGEFLPGCEAS